MKKAKEYAAELIAEPTEQKLGEIAQSFLLEIRETVLARGCQQDSAFVSVLNGQREKWRAFYRKVSCHSVTEGMNVREDGFERIVRHQLPEVYGAWSALEPRVRIQEESV